MPIRLARRLLFGPESRNVGMRSLLKSDFFWQFVGGFAIGAIGVVSLHPSQVIDSFGHHAEAPAQANS